MPDDLPYAAHRIENVYLVRAKYGKFVSAFNKLMPQILLASLHTDHASLLNVVNLNDSRYRL